MANPVHLEILKQGVEVWNKWRDMNPTILPVLGATTRGTKPDLSGLDLSGVDLSFAYLFDANLRKTNLSKADLSYANVGRANLSYADFTGANLSYAALMLARMGYANLSHSNLVYANLAHTSLSHANLSNAMLLNANFNSVKLNKTNFTNAVFCYTNFNNTDLSTAKGLETVKHRAPSFIGIDTLYESKGKIPETFLRGCGLPESFIVQISALVASTEPIQFHSCFISYSHKDEKFAQRLHSRMRDLNLRVWYAPEDMKGGQKLHEQIFSAIQVHDKLLLVLSDSSLQSEWVATEIRRARKTEREENRRKLFPIRLVDFDAIQKWECFDADSGKDLAVELREYYIPDFSHWKDHDAFEAAFDRLLRDLKAGE